MTDPAIGHPAPPIEASHWFNTSAPLSLAHLRGKVVAIEAFQMLCPGCVSTGLPQAARIAGLFPADLVQVIGLHTVFEHHAVQGTPAALEAFIHEYRWPFPIALDRAVEGERLPLTMQAYRLQGTPSLILVDRHGMIRHQHFGQVEDMVVGAQIMALVQETATGLADQTRNPDDRQCGPDGCPA